MLQQFGRCLSYSNVTMSGSVQSKILQEELDCPAPRPESTRLVRLEMQITNLSLANISAFQVILEQMKTLSKLRQRRNQNRLESHCIALAFLFFCMEGNCHLKPILFCKRNSLR